MIHQPAEFPVKGLNPRKLYCDYNSWQSGHFNTTYNFRALNVIEWLDNKDMICLMFTKYCLHKEGVKIQFFIFDKLKKNFEGHILLVNKLIENRKKLLSFSYEAWIIVTLNREDRKRSLN